MPLILPGNVGSATAATGFDVANSCRFDGASSSMKITPGSNMNLLLITWSGWIKRSGLGTVQSIFAADNAVNSTGTLYFDANDKLNFQNVSGNADKGLKITTRVFRDPSAWMHLVWAWDSANSTAGDRIKIYVNGVRETVFDSSTNPDVNEPSQLGESGVATLIGTYVGEDSRFWNGYMAEVVLIDGAALAADQFGEFDDDSGIWKPIDVSGLTFGTHGFYLDFEASDNLGNDANGGTDLTESGLAAIDQSIDTCTNNFATMNPLDNFYYNGTFSEGNLKGINGSSREASATATIAISNGKWFWEVQPKTNVAPFIGIQQSPSAANTSSGASMSTNGYGYLKTGKVETSDGSGGSTVLAEYATYAADDIIGVAVDLDGNKIYFYKNGALQGSGVTITAVGSTTNGHYLIAFGALGGQDTFEINFGSPPYSESGGETDGDGFGNFAHAVPSGYFALCTKNLAEYG